jgi:hypothetical protein
MVGVDDFEVYAEKYTDYIMNVPDFKIKIFNDPKGMYIDYCTISDDINDAIKRIKKLAIKSGIYLSYEDKSITLEDTQAYMDKYCGIIASLRKSMDNLEALSGVIDDIKRAAFESLFVMTEVEFCNNIYLGARNSPVYIFDTKKGMLDFMSTKEDYFDSIVFEKLDEPLIVNTLRFNALELKDGNFKIVESDYTKSGRSGVCAEVADGQWVVKLTDEY